VLRVAHAAEGFGFDQDRAFAVAGAVDGFFRGGVDSNDIVAVDDVALDAVGFGAVGEIFDGDLAADGCRVGPLIVF
jgi:hypothetical protein